MGLLWIFLISVGVLSVLGIVYFVISVLISQKYWKKRNVYTLSKCWVPLLGHMGSMILKTKSFPEMITDFYNELKSTGKDYGGIYVLKSASLVVVNPKLIGEITIKQFDHFVNRRSIVDQSVDILFGRSLLGLQDDEWRGMRHHLSPAFTGAKLRGMMGLIESTCTKFSDFLSNRPDPNEPLNIHDGFRRMAADLIATTAFGSPSDSITNPESAFYKNGVQMMDLQQGSRAFIMALYMTVPALMKKLKIPFVPKSLHDFFTNQILSSIEYRERENKSRADMIQLLLDARKADPSKPIPNMDIASQAFTFFLGGFETMATAFSFTSHRLAMHPEIQSRARDEIREMMENNEGKLNYDTVKQLKYLDMVISEVLRMHPPAPAMDRLCSKNVTFPEFNLSLEKGDSVLIPFYGFHFDPEHFPDPEKFDPERFSDENKQNIKPFTYMPFGEGPRNCIGKRFAMLELKLGLALILSKHELQVCEKTNVSNPFEYTKKVAMMQPEGGFWLSVKPLSEE